MSDGSTSEGATEGRATRLRDGRPADLDELVRLETSAFAGDRIARRRMRAFSTGSETARIVVAESGAFLLGYALVLLRKSSRIARLYSLAVDPSATGRGIGRALLAGAESAAVRAGADALRLEVRTDNRAAISLYETAGYREIGRREGYYADGSPALRFERRLDARPDLDKEPLGADRAAPAAG